ncbi:MAG: periplasmic heavy metal sensor [Candidatus Aminicenantes bacterium]|nr:periplasmic heavy metal sensor [Candidatus Aminicenantes bacterium]
MQIRRLFLFAFCFLFVGSIFLTAMDDEEYQIRKRIRESVNTLRLLKMTEVLDLTEEQAAKIFPALNRTEKDKRDINRQIGQKLKELRLILAKEELEEQEIEQAIGELKKLRNALRVKDEELEKIIEENLTLVQRAKYVVFSVDFYRGLREKIDRARKLQKRLEERNRR